MRKLRLLFNFDYQFRRYLWRYYQNQRIQAKERRSFPLTPPALLKEVDSEKLEAIRTKHVIPNPGIRVEKYLEMERWFATNIRRILNLGIDFRRNKRVLDLGSGAGYFLHICKRLGHDVLGLDIPDVGWFGQLTDLLGVRRVICEIQPFVPLPDLGKKFDYVTAYMVCFNGHNSDKVWKIEQWRFFLDDLAKHLNYGAVIWFELNPEPDGTHYTPELKRFFEERGAIVDRNRLIWGISQRRYEILQDLSRREAASLRKLAAKEAVQVVCPMND